MDPLKIADANRKIEHLFEQMSSNHSSATCYRALSELRTGYIPRPQLLSLFIQAGGIRQIVEQLKKSNKKIVDVSLSILGHCVMEQEARAVVSKILTILKFSNFYDKTSLWLFIS